MLCNYIASLRVLLTNKVGRKGERNGKGKLIVVGFTACARMRSVVSFLEYVSEVVPDAYSIMLKIELRRGRFCCAENI